MNDIESTIKTFLLDLVLPTTDPDELTLTTPLISGAILDSLTTVRLVLFLEQHFGIEVQAHEVHVENMDTLERIASLVRRKQATA